MAVAGRGHRNAGGKIEKFVAVHIGDDDSTSALGHHGVRTRIGRRNIFLIALKHTFSVRSGQGSLDLGSGSCGHSLGSHWSSSVARATGSRPIRIRIGPRLQLWWKRKNTEANQANGGISRYRRGWDEAAKADWPDSAADRPGSAASTRLHRHGKTRIGILLQHREHATSLIDYSRSCAGRNPPLVMNIVGVVMINVGTAAARLSAASKARTVPCTAYPHGSFDFPPLAP